METHFTEIYTMRFRAIAGAMLSPALAVSVASAQAPAPTGSASCDLTGVTFGSPHNTADKSQVTCTTFGAVQIALAAAARFNGANPTPPPVVETGPGTGTYIVSPGEGNPSGSGLALWNFNFAITGYAPTDVFELLIDRDPGPGTTFRTFILNPADDPDHGLSYQNSENEGFFNTPGDVFNPSASGTYTIEVRYLAGGTGPGETASINVVASPEPASMALLATGFAGLGFTGVARRRRGAKAS